MVSHALVAVTRTSEELGELCSVLAKRGVSLTTSSATAHRVLVQGKIAHKHSPQASETFEIVVLDDESPPEVVRSNALDFRSTLVLSTLEDYAHLARSEDFESQVHSLKLRKRTAAKALRGAAAALAKAASDVARFDGVEVVVLGSAPVSDVLYEALSGDDMCTVRREESPEEPVIVVSDGESKKLFGTSRAAASLVACASDALAGVPRAPVHEFDSLAAAHEFAKSATFASEVRVVATHEDESEAARRLSRADPEERYSARSREDLLSHLSRTDPVKSVALVETHGGVRTRFALCDGESAVVVDDGVSSASSSYAVGTYAQRISDYCTSSGTALVGILTLVVTKNVYGDDVVVSATTPESN